MKWWCHIAASGSVMLNGTMITSSSSSSPPSRRSWSTSGASIDLGSTPSKPRLRFLSLCNGERCLCTLRCLESLSRDVPPGKYFQSSKAFTWKHLYRRFPLTRYQKFELLLTVMVSVTFQAKEVAFKSHLTSDACFAAMFLHDLCRMWLIQWALGRWTLKLMVCGWERAIRKSPLLLTIMVGSPWQRSRHPLSTKTRLVTKKSLANDYVENARTNLRRGTLQKERMNVSSFSDQTSRLCRSTLP